MIVRTEAPRASRTAFARKTPEAGQTEVMASSIKEGSTRLRMRRHAARYGFNFQAAMRARHSRTRRPLPTEEWLTSLAGPV